MAFSHIRRAAIGGGLSAIWGNFTNTVGAADQTLDIQGNVVLLDVHPNVTAEPVDYRNVIDVGTADTTTGMSTVTIRSEAAISDGRFFMIVAS